MTHVSFRCSSCQKLLKADESRFGRRIRCPNCNVDVTVPHADAPAPAAAEPARPALPPVLPDQIKAVPLAGTSEPQVAGRKQGALHITPAMLIIVAGVALATGTAVGMAVFRVLFPPVALTPANVPREAGAAMSPAPAERPAGGPTADPLAIEIDNYEFSWELIAIGEAKIRVVKDEDTTLIWILEDFSGVRLTGEEAEAVGAVLATTSERYEAHKQKGGETRDSVPVGGTHSVNFSTDPVIGFRVSIRNTETFGSSVSLDRHTALAFAPELSRARALIAHVDESVHP
jgi:DNA-directed RNA polymerase subunit RPC12/RpoP